MDYPNNPVSSRLTDENGIKRNLSALLGIAQVGNGKVSLEPIPVYDGSLQNPLGETTI